MDYETSRIMPQLKVGMIHKKCVRMLLEGVILPQDSFRLAIGLLIGHE